MTDIGCIQGDRMIFGIFLFVCRKYRSVFHALLGHLLVEASLATLNRTSPCATVQHKRTSTIDRPPDLLYFSAEFLLVSLLIVSPMHDKDAACWNTTVQRKRTMASVWEDVREYADIMYNQHFNQFNDVWKVCDPSVPCRVSRLGQRFLTIWF